MAFITSAYSLEHHKTRQRNSCACLRGISLGEKRVLQDMICCSVLFILLKGRGTSYLAQGISYLVGGIYVTNILTIQLFYNNSKLIGLYFLKVGINGIKVKHKNLYLKLKWLTKNLHLIWLDYPYIYVPS